MEAIIILVVAYFFTRKAVSSSYTDILDLPVGKNEKGYYDNTAFTQIYLARRETRKNEKQEV